MQGLVETFAIERLRYKMVVTQTGQIAFWLEGGTTSSGVCLKHELFEDCPVYCDVDLLSCNPIAVFARVSSVSAAGLALKNRTSSMFDRVRREE